MLELQQSTTTTIRGYGSRVALAEPVIGRAFARSVGSLARDDSEFAVTAHIGRYVRTSDGTATPSLIWPTDWMMSSPSSWAKQA